jgi:ubiquinone/menaquinone biosynthesis C-methylase UbiE
MQEYLMESEEETLRLDLKTDEETVAEQAIWAGIKPGMRVADLGFGSGKTTFHLHKLVHPFGTSVGLDIAEERIRFAQKHYSAQGIEYMQRDICEPLEDLGMFDFIWVRFVLEYYSSKSYEIVKNITKILKPGGILCLIDLDNNCLGHFGFTKRFERTLSEIMEKLSAKADFDPYAGRKLYSFLYDLEYDDIDVAVSSHHLIFGELNEIDSFNWTKKVEIAAKNAGCRFAEYNGGYDEFYNEFLNFFSDPRRFTYTPIVACRGRKPAL